MTEDYEAVSGMPMCAELACL